MKAYFVSLLAFSLLSPLQQASATSCPQEHKGWEESKDAPQLNHIKSFLPQSSLEEDLTLLEKQSLQLIQGTTLERVTEEFTKAWGEKDFKQYQHCIENAFKGEPEAQTELGHSYRMFSEYKKSLGWLIRAALQPNTGGGAETEIGTLYEAGTDPLGKGLPDDVTRANYWYQLGAQKGSRDARIYLGLEPDDPSC